MVVTSKLKALKSARVPSIAVAGAVALGTAVLTFAIADRDWHRERAHDQSMAGRGTYR